MLRRERKKRVEAAEAFRAGGREEQAETEEVELDVIDEFLPEASPTTSSSASSTRRSPRPARRA